MKSVSDSHTKNQGISTVSGSENSAGQTSKKMIEAYENGMK
jgi:hypothetical protein